MAAGWGGWRVFVGWCGFVGLVSVGFVFFGRLVGGGMMECFLQAMERWCRVFGKKEHYRFFLYAF